ncbi:MAG: hypothetical protein E6J20_02040 [Chloroflexi bacterium]|nr:MAG: hypothetical protein E6J20_02040 [Chloroflexota bacterium]
MTVLVAGLVLGLYILISYGVGRLIVAVAGFQVDGLVRAGCPLIGAGAMAIQLWIFGVIHVPWFVIFLVGPWVVVAAIARRRLVAAMRDDAEALRRSVGSLRDLDPLTAGIAAFTLATLGFYLLNLLAQPLVGWDAIAMWMFKARVFFDSGSVNLANLPVYPLVGSRHLDYPPLFSLMVDTTWVLIGRIDDMAGKSIGLMFLISAVGAVMASLSPILGRRLTVLLAFILVAMPAMQTSFIFPYYIGYADYALATLILLSLAFLYRSARVGRDEDSTLAFVFASFAALTKNEGIPFLLIVVVVLGSGVAWAMLREHDRPTVRLMATAVAVLIPVLAWQVYARVHGFNSDVLTKAHPSWTVGVLTSRAHTIALFFWHLMNRLDDYPWLAAAWIVSTALTALSRYRRLTLVWGVFSAQAIVLGLALLLTPNDVSFELNTAADRLVLQLAPSLVLLLGLALRELPRRNVAEISAGEAIA